MPKGKKNTDDDIVMDNFKGFFKRGAATRTPGNIPTGYFDLDFVLHYGKLPKNVDLNSLEGYDPSVPLGLPRGKLVEIFGEEGSGKSSLAYRVCGYAQRMGFNAAWIDTENSFSEDLAKVNGLDADKLIFSDMVSDTNVDEIFTAEYAFDSIVRLCKENAIAEKKVAVIVIDSVASLVPKARMEADADKLTPGLLARLMAENLKKVTNYAAKYGVLIIFINQVRDKIGVMFGNPETTPGGRALKFESSIRIRISKKNTKDAIIKRQLDDGSEDTLGRLTYFRIAKNRFAEPFDDALELPIYYKKHFPTVEETIFDTGRQLRVISYQKGEYKWIDADIRVESKADFIEHVRLNDKMDDLIIAIRDKAQEKNMLLPIEVGAEVSKVEERLKKAVKEKSDTVSEDDNPKTTSVRRGRKRKDSSESSSDSENE